LSLPQILLPVSLPPWRLAPHEHMLLAPYEDVAVATGPARRRRTTTTAPRDVVAELVVRQAQATTFHRWFEGVLQAGTLEFTAAVRKLGGGRFTLEWWRARILERGSDEPLARGWWRIPVVLRLTGTPSDTPPAITGMAMEIVVPLMARAALTSSWAMAMEIAVPLNARVDSGGMAMEIGAPLAAIAADLSGAPDGGDLERIWVRLAATPVPGNEIDRSDQELVQRAWVRW
jgi:hypothetical protein